MLYIVIDDDNKTWWITYPVATTNVSLSIEPCQRALNNNSNMYENAGILPINITIVNNGVLIENFTVKIYANDTSIENKTVLVSAGGSETVSFLLPHACMRHASVLQNGVYNISVRVMGEIEYADNLVDVYLAGDVDRSDDVDIFDIVAIADLYLISEGDGKYEVRFDLDCNGKINIFDVVIAADHYGESW